MNNPTGEPKECAAPELDAIKMAEREIIPDEFASDYSEGDTRQNEKEPEADPIDLNALREMCTSLLQAGFGMLATRRGEHWAISEDEAKAIGEPLADILNEAGVVVETPEMRLAIAATFVLLPRIMLDRKGRQGQHAQPVDHTDLNGQD